MLFYLPPAITISNHLWSANPTALAHITLRSGVYFTEKIKAIREKLHSPSQNLSLDLFLIFFTSVYYSPITLFLTFWNSQLFLKEFFCSVVFTYSTSIHFSIHRNQITSPLDCSKTPVGGIVSHVHQTMDASPFFFFLPDQALGMFVKSWLYWTSFITHLIIPFISWASSCFLQLLHFAFFIGQKCGRQKCRTGKSRSRDYHVIKSGP